jgi:phosphatidylinositol alpha-1,6-mannosyltransferase
MKIALLSEKYTPDIGGLAISAERLARLLAAAGHDVHVFAPSLSSAIQASAHLPASAMRTFHVDGVHVTRFGARKRVDDTLVDWFEILVQEHEQRAFDVLHGYFLAQAGFVATYAGAYLNVPSVVSIRGNDIERAAFDPSRFSHVMYALQRADAITANARALARKASALVPNREIMIIPNGVDTEHFKPLPRNTALSESLNLSGKKRANVSSGVIGFAGELREKKGLGTLLTAYAQVLKRYPATLLILGDIRPGEDRQAVEEFKRSYPMAQIVVTGFVSPRYLPDYYSLMDVFVQPSVRDGLPNALLEALACERAVIGTSVGGIADVIKNCENGRLVPANDATALTDTLEELLRDESTRTSLGKAGRQTIATHFSLQAELDGNLAIYRQLGLPV